MKRIPAVTRTIVVEPEKIILEVGDTPRILDLSYSLLLDADKSSWIRQINNQTLGHMDKVTVVGVNLRVPCPRYILQFNFPKDQQILQRSINDEDVYLDTMIQDKFGNYWLTLARFLKIMD